MGIKEFVHLEKENKEDIKIPKHFKVILLNDEFTSMDFVVNVLINIFKHNFDAAVKIMLKIHNEGKAVCGIYTYDIAETKVEQVKYLARDNEYPLRAIVEEA